MQVDGSFAHAGELAKGDVFDLARLNLRVTMAHRDKDRIGFSPVARVTVAAIEQNVAENHLAELAAVAGDQADAAIGLKDWAVVHRDMADIGEGFGADFDGATFRADQAITHHHVTGRLLELFWLAGRFDTDAIIGSAEVAIANVHMLAAVDIQRIGVGQRQIVIDGQILDEYLIAAHQMRGPHRRIADGDITNAHLLAAFQHQHARAHGFRLAITLLIGALREPGARAPRQTAFAAERNVMSVARINQRHTGEFSNGLRQLRRIILSVRAGQQTRAGLQMQGKVWR